MFYPDGVIASLVTPFDSSGDVDEKGMVQSIEFQKGAGSQGVCVLGGTGEPMSIERRDREKLMKLAVETSKGKIDVIVGALVGNPEEVAYDVEAAKRAGAQACLVTATPFVRPSDKDVERFFSHLATLEMPLVLFNTPSRSGSFISPDMIQRLSATYETIVGVKESSRDIITMTKVRSKCPSPFAVLQGVDSLFFFTMAAGGNGGILAAAAVFPEVYAAIVKSVDEADLSRARVLHYRMMPLIDMLYEASHPAPLKVALEARGFLVGKTKPPLYGISDDHALRVREEVHGILGDFESLGLTQGNG